jgi:hypothetical protein
MRTMILTLAALMLMAVIAVPAAAQTVPGGYDEVGGIIGERTPPRTAVVEQPPAQVPPAAQVQPDAVAPRAVTQAQAGQLAQTGLGLTTGAALGISLLLLGFATLYGARRRAATAAA